MDEMLKVMFVDDEHLVRSLLRNCIDWQEIGYEVVGEAPNAPEALEMVEALCPDVIFTDINMPYMDGLEFGRIVYEKYANIKIIILTGYEEFEYAKRGIKIGISDFLLKPINDDEIRKVAVEIRAKILLERKEKGEMRRIRKQLEDSMPYLREKALNEMVQSPLDSDSLRQRIDYFHIHLDPSFVQIAAIEASLEGDAAGEGEENRLLLRMQCRELVEKYFRDDEKIHIFFDNHPYIIVLCGDKEVNLDECMTAIHTMLVNKMRCYACIGIGNRYDPLHIKASYREAIQALQYKIVIGNNSIISYEDIRLGSANEPAQGEEAFEEFAFFLKTGMRKKVNEFLTQAFANINSAKRPARLDALRALAASVLSVILNVVAETEVTLNDIIPDTTQPFDRIFRLDTLPEMRQYLEEIAEKVMSVIQGMQSKKVNRVIAQVQAYVLEHLSDPELTLSSIAKIHFINMSYLSRIFKQETGHNFVEYLTTIRMEKAVKLLKETDMKAYQVAEAVGIVNPHYFGICFKKWTGVSVSDFKKQ